MEKVDYNRTYAVLFSIQFGKGIPGCGNLNLFNRESPRINANRIFLAPSCSAPAYRLRRNRTPSGKMLSEKPACRFFSPLISLFVKSINYETTEKPARGFFL